MADKPTRNRGLGRGLSALMADVGADAASSSAPRRPDQHIPIEQVHPNPDQPRRHFDDEALQDLAASIREKGIIQPLIVRRDPSASGRYQIVAGERRWRAAQIAQLHEVPALVRDYDDTEMLEVAIIENIQRSDLNSVDEAAGYKQLMERFGHTQEQLASALSKSRSHIANSLRLLSLPEDVQAMLVTQSLTAGHARALIGHPNASELARQIVQKKLSVRETERLVKQGTSDTSAKNSKRPAAQKDADTQQIEAELTATLKMKVAIDHNPNGEGGKLSVSYRDLDQLDDLLRLLAGN